MKPRTKTISITPIKPPTLPVHKTHRFVVKMRQIERDKALKKIKK
jgi:hypothetical protein